MALVDDEAHDLRGVEDQADVVEGGGDEAARADPPPAVLVDEGAFEREGREEAADAGYEVFELRGAGRDGVGGVVGN